MHGIKGDVRFSFALGIVPFTAIAFILGFFMAIGKAAVYRHIPWPDQGWKGSNSWRILAGSPSNSVEGMTPKSPSPALKTVMQTMRVVARFHARA